MPSALRVPLPMWRRAPPSICGMVLPRTNRCQPIGRDAGGDPTSAERMARERGGQATPRLSMAVWKPEEIPLRTLVAIRIDIVRPLVWSGERGTKYVEQRLPGADLIQRGIVDLRAGTETVEALLVSIGATRLRSLGVEMSAPIDSPEHKLYRLLAQEKGNGAHSAYNALIRRLVSFERSARCAI